MQGKTSQTNPSTMGSEWVRNQTEFLFHMLFLGETNLQRMGVFQGQLNSTQCPTPHLNAVEKLIGGMTPKSPGTGRETLDPIWPWKDSR